MRILTGPDTHLTWGEAPRWEAALGGGDPRGGDARGPRRAATGTSVTSRDRPGRSSGPGLDAAAVQAREQRSSSGASGKSRGAYPMAQAVREQSSGSRGVEEASARGEERRELGRWRGDPAQARGSGRGDSGIQHGRRGSGGGATEALGSRRRYVTAAIRVVQLLGLSLQISCNHMVHVVKEEEASQSPKRGQEGFVEHYAVKTGYFSAGGLVQSENQHWRSQRMYVGLPSM